MKKPQDYLSHGMPQTIEIETKDLIELIREVQKDILFEQAYLDKLLSEERIDKKEYERKINELNKQIYG